MIGILGKARFNDKFKNIPYSVKEPYDKLPPHNSVKLYNGESIYGVHITTSDLGIQIISFLIGK